METVSFNQMNENIAASLCGIFLPTDTLRTNRWERERERERERESFDRREKVSFERRRERERERGEREREREREFKNHHKTIRGQCLLFKVQSIDIAAGKAFVSLLWTKELIYRKLAQACLLVRTVSHVNIVAHGTHVNWTRVAWWNFWSTLTKGGSSAGALGASPPVWNILRVYFRKLWQQNMHKLYCN